jgi:hypothetical protein
MWQGATKRSPAAGQEECAVMGNKLLLTHCIAFLFANLKQSNKKKSQPRDSRSAPSSDVVANSLSQKKHTTAYLPCRA